MPSFIVNGIPKPKGSTVCLGGQGRKRHLIVESDPDKSKAEWAARVTETAQAAASNLDGPLDGPVAVRCRFVLPRPPSAPKGRRLPSFKPDVDKLARAVLDPLTKSGLILDDSRVTDLTAIKRYPDLSSPWTYPHAFISVTAIPQGMPEGVPWIDYPQPTWQCPQCGLQGSPRAVTVAQRAYDTHRLVEHD